MKYLLPLLLLSVFLIPIAQSSFAQQQMQQQQNEFKAILNQILPKLQNLTHTLSGKMQQLKNNATTEINQTSSNAKQSFMNQILPKLQNLTHTLSGKMQQLKNNATPELNQADKSISQEINNTKATLGQLLNKVFPNTY